MKRRYIFCSLALLLFHPGGSLFSDGADWDQYLKEVREKSKLRTLRRSALIDQVASRYARQLVLRGFLSHEDPSSGERGLDRLRAGGSTAFKAGEVLGTGKSKRAIREAWLRSPKHRQVLVGSDWFRYGVGEAQTEENVFVAVLLFSSSIMQSRLREDGARNRLSFSLIPGISAKDRIFVFINGREHPIIRTGHEVLIRVPRGRFPAEIMIYLGKKQYPKDILILNNLK